MLGERSWSFEWLERRQSGYGIISTRFLDFDPPSAIRNPDSKDRNKLSVRLARVKGTLREYRGPQNAQMDLGSHLMAKITPLERLARDDEGAEITAYISFSYDGLIGWDASRAEL